MKNPFETESLVILTSNYTAKVRQKFELPNFFHIFFNYFYNTALVAICKGDLW